MCDKFVWLGMALVAGMAASAGLVPEKYYFLDEYEDASVVRPGAPTLTMGMVSPGLLTRTHMGVYRGEKVPLYANPSLPLPPCGAKKLVYSVRVYGFGDDLRKDAALVTEFTSDGGALRLVVRHAADKADLLCTFGSQRLSIPYGSLPADFVVRADSWNPAELRVTSLADSQQRTVRETSAVFKTSHQAITRSVGVTTTLESARPGTAAEVKVDQLFVALAKPAPKPVAVPTKIVPQKDFDPVKAGWKLAFSDEFEGATVDKAKWEDRHGRPELLRVEDGKLIIDCVDDGKGGLKTASLWSWHQQRYGYFESRLKFTKENGWWAAFWLYADSISNPFVDGFEIDIFEDYHTRRKDAAGRNLNILDHNLHTHVTGSLKSWNYYEQFAGSLDEYHVIGCKWTPFEISYYLDGRLIESSAVHSPWDSVTFDAFHHIAGSVPLRTIVSGQVMAPNASWLKGCTQYDAKDLPYHYYVDYVRVYEYPDPVDEKPSVTWARDYPSGTFLMKNLGDKVSYEVDVKEAAKTKAKIAAVYLFDSGYLLECKTSAPWRFDLSLTQEYFDKTDFVRPGRQGQKPKIEGGHALQVFVADENGRIASTDKVIEFFLMSTRLKSRPYEGKAATIPGVLRICRYDEGGEGVAYHDGTKGNQHGGKTNTRMNEDVDCTPHGLGAVGRGEWINFTVDIAEAGDYVLKFRHGNPTTTPQSLLLLCDFKPVGEVSCPGHETKYGWSTRQEAQMPVTLPAGRHILRFVFNGGYNLTDFTFEKR